MSWAVERFIAIALREEQIFWYCGALKTSKKKSRVPLAAFETGQIWKLSDSNLHIGMIGKTLVHYKHFKVAAKRAPVSLCNKAVLERYLADNDAVLVSA